LFVAAMHEWKRSVQTSVGSFMGLQTRVEKVLDVSIAREVEKLESHLLVLATVASAGPFVGLFGTVWGIMTSFRSIAASKNFPPSSRARSTSTPARAATRPEEAIMGMAVSPGAKGGRRRRGVPRYRAMADINMTPFIDVMLVLLIIFMVAAPLLSSGVPIDLPATKAGELNIDKKPIAVAIDDRGDIYLMDQKVADADLVAAVQAQAKDGADERVYVRASKGVAYGRVAEVMSDLTAAGFKKVALVTNQEKK
jgi:biopolymer transport protein TolR